MGRRYADAVRQKVVPKVSPSLRLEPFGRKAVIEPRPVGAPSECVAAVLERRADGYAGELGDSKRASA